MAGVKYEFSYVFSDTFQPPQQQDWVLYRNTSFELDLNIVDDTEQPVDLTGWCGELIIEYLQAYLGLTGVPERGNVIKYKLIANRTTDTLYFNTKFGSFLIDDANGNVKFKLTALGTSKDNRDATYHGESSPFTQTEGPLLCNEAKYELRFKYTDPETSEETYIRPLFGNISFVNTHTSTEDQLPCEGKIETSPTITSLDLNVIGDPLTYTSGDDILLNAIIFQPYFEFNSISETVYLFINNNKILINKFNIPLSYISYNNNPVSKLDLSQTSMSLTDRTVVDGDEIKLAILTDSGQQIVSNTFIVDGGILTPRTLYFNHNNTTGSWDNISYWYEDETFETQASEFPTNIDSVIITSSVNYPNPVTVYSLIVNGPDSQFSIPLIYKVPTIAQEMIFNGNTEVKSDLICTRSNPIIFNDYSQAGGNVLGTTAASIKILGVVRFNNNSKNYAIIDSANFYNDAQNASTSFYDNVSLSLPLEGLVSKANFYNDSKNYGKIVGYNLATGGVSYNLPICVNFTGTECLRYESNPSKNTSVSFYDNSCHFGAVSTARLPGWNRPTTFNPNNIELDNSAISPFPPPICSS